VGISKRFRSTTFGTADAAEPARQKTEHGFQTDALRAGNRALP
jgi:hypothetical protein